MYTNLTDGIGWLLDSFVGEIDSFKKNVKLSHQQNNKTENDMRRLSMCFTISKNTGWNPEADLVIKTVTRWRVQLLLKERASY